MAVRVPKGESKIVFTYETPGWKTGCVISICAAAGYAVYLGVLVFLRIKKKKASRAA